MKTKTKSRDAEAQRLKRLAKKIARWFFTDWCGKPTVRRLVIERQGKKLEGAGYCEEAVKDTIMKHLLRANKKKGGQ